MDWASISDRASLPIVVQADQAGTRKIKVRFLDENNGSVQEKTLTIRFKKGAA